MKARMPKNHKQKNPDAESAPAKAASASAIRAENALLLREGQKIAEALGKMFAPCCEVVLNDLTGKQPVIHTIACPLSGRAAGQAGTEMGHARIKNADFPDVVQNYANTFPDGRPVKSTSIGLRNSQGKCIAALCLNLDVSLFSSLQKILDQFTASGAHSNPVSETLRSRSLDDVRDAIDTYAAQFNLPARALSMPQRRALVRKLEDSGLLQLRGAASMAAEVLGISRTSIYNALKNSL